MKKTIISKILSFREQRNWKQFHTPKNLAISLVLEATEFLEHFQWLRTDKESAEYIQKNKNDLEDELADVYYWVLLLSHDLDIDLEKALERKMKKNEEKYPVEKSKNTSKKYTKL